MFYDFSTNFVWNFLIVKRTWWDIIVNAHASSSSKLPFILSEFNKISSVHISQRVIYFVCMFTKSDLFSLNVHNDWSIQSARSQRVAYFVCMFTTSDLVCLHVYEWSIQTECSQRVIYSVCMFTTSDLFCLHVHNEWSNICGSVHHA